MDATDDADRGDIALPEYWDKRYANEKPGDPTHEWFLNYKELASFLEKKLFSARPPQSSPRILHLGSGKSVSSGHRPVAGPRWVR